MDSDIHPELLATLARHCKPNGIASTVLAGDFIESAVNTIQFGLDRYTHAILNPPYKKIGSDSRARHLLRQVGIETVNLYSAFLALTILLMKPRGQVVAIIPRSFCNGPYYKPFRRLLLERAAIRRIHLFDSRSTAFKDDKVLQENIILVLETEAPQGDVRISTSTDDSFHDLEAFDLPFGSVVKPEDSECVIHIPTSTDIDPLDGAESVRYSLDEIGIKVSTGPIVDFRLKEFLRENPTSNSVPLLYPVHLKGFQTEWPRSDTKKSNAIDRNPETEKWLYPIGYYCVVKRFSSKEEKRRVVATLIKPEVFDSYDRIGFENHLNVYHENRHGLPQKLAFGLATFLNSTAIDLHFRRFNGHTQVNASDLKLFKYPSRECLISLGVWALSEGAGISQERIDEKVSAIIHGE